MWLKVHFCLICPDFKNIHGAITSRTEAGDNVESRSTEKPGQETLKALRDTACWNVQIPTDLTQTNCSVCLKCASSNTTHFTFCVKKRTNIRQTVLQTHFLLCVKKIKAYWFHLLPKPLECGFKFKNYMQISGWKSVPRNQILKCNSCMHEKILKGVTCNIKLKN